MAKTIEQKLNILVNRLNRVENDLDKKISILLNTKETSNSFFAKLQREILKDYDEAKLVYAEWNKIVILVEYNKNIAKQIRRIKDRKYYKPPTKVNTVKFLNSDRNKQTIASVLNSSISTYSSALDMGQKKVLGLLRTTQQSNVAEVQINKLVSEGFFEKGSTFGAKKKLMAEFEKVIDGKYIQIIDKNGKPVMWHLDTYATMLARTKISDAMALGTINTALKYKTDLVQVSAHNTITPICLPFEGKIFSISGTDPFFPILTTLPPFHPNCLHVIVVMFEDAMKINGTYDKFVEFSNGKTFTHPTRASFIPTNDIKARVINYNKAHTVVKKGKSIVPITNVNKQVKSITTAVAAQ